MGANATSTKWTELSNASAGLVASGFAGAINAVRPFLGSADRKLSREAWKLVALSVFEQENNEEGMVLFQGLAAVSTGAADWFSVINAGTLAGGFSTVEYALLNTGVIQVCASAWQRGIMGSTKHHGFSDVQFVAGNVEECCCESCKFFGENVCRDRCAWVAWLW